MVGASEADEATLSDAHEVGVRLAELGAVVVTGGRTGVMEAVSRGAGESGGLTVGLLPGTDRREANPWIDVALPTGLGELRNGLIVRAADVVIAVGRGYGTLSEIALALRAEVPVIGLRSWDIDGMRTAGTPAEAVRLAVGGRA